MNCGQTASIPQSGQNESKHHDLSIQNRPVREDGSTESQRQVDILMASDKFMLSILYVEILQLTRDRDFYSLGAHFYHPQVAN